MIADLGEREILLMLQQARFMDAWRALHPSTDRLGSSGVRQRAGHAPPRVFTRCKESWQGGEALLVPHGQRTVRYHRRGL